MLKADYFSLLVALAFPALAVAEVMRTLPLIACLSKDDIAKQVHLTADYRNGIEAVVEEPTDELTGNCLLHGAEKQIKFGQLDVSAARGTEASFQLHTWAGEDEIMNQICTFTILDWPSKEKMSFYGMNVKKVFPSQNDVSNGHAGREDGLFDVKCSGLSIN